MKNYFAKYLPVKGEIKEGDKFVQQKEILTKGSGKQRVAGGGDIKLIKLFLVNRDIQVRDEVINLEIDSTPITIDNIVNNSVWFQETPGEYKLKDCFKVVGEIILDALVYVKENQEFDETDLEPLLYCIKHPDESIPLGNIKQLSEWMNLNPNPTKYKVVISIKCPTCKHFH